MVRSQRRLLVIVIAVFVGLYLLNQNVYFGNFGHGNWYFFGGHIPWVKWLLLGLGLWIVISCLSNRPSSRYSSSDYDDDIDDRRYRRRHDQIVNRIDELQKEITELRHRRDRMTRESGASGRDKKLDDLTKRIENLEKIVTSRRYRLDDEFDQL